MISDSYSGSGRHSNIETPATSIISELTNINPRLIQSGSVIPHSAQCAGLRESKYLYTMKDRYMGLFDNSHKHNSHPSCQYRISTPRYLSARTAHGYTNRKSGSYRERDRGQNESSPGTPSEPAFDTPTGKSSKKRPRTSSPFGAYNSSLPCNPKLKNLVCAIPIYLCAAWSDGIEL